MVYLLIMANSSQIRRAVSYSRDAVSLCLVKLHTLQSLIVMGILKIVCAVRSPDMINAAMHDIMVATAIRPSARTVVINAL